MSAAHPEALIALLKISVALSVLVLAVVVAVVLADWMEHRWPQKNRRL